MIQEKTEKNFELIGESENSYTPKIETDLISIRLVNNKESFDKLADNWRELAKAAGVPVYLSFDWLACWWKHFGEHPRRSPFIIAVYCDQQLRGIAPFYKGESSVGPVTLQKRIHLMGSGTSGNEMLGFTNDYGYSDFLDVIAHPDYEETVADSLVNIFKQNRVDADIVCFQHVSDESFVVRKILPRLKEDHLDYEIEQTDECPFITLPDSMDTYLDEIGSSSRRRRFRKNLKPAGKKYNVEDVSSINSVREGVEILYNLHQEQWNSQGYPGAFFDKRHYSFIKEMSETALKNRWLWFKIAKDEEGVAAVRWTLKYNNRFFDCFTAFDISSPSAKYSPGLGLLAVLIKEAIEKNASRIELLRGAERYKFDFTRESRLNWRITLPLYQKKSVLYFLLNMLINKMAKVYSILQNEVKLLHVHRQKAGWVKMFYSYASFRLKRLASMFDDMKLFSIKN